MRIGVVDIGTNSTRLLVCDVQNGRVTEELARESRVTRLGQGVDATGRLGEEPMGRVYAVLDDYRRALDDLGVEATTAVLTSAVRDASNGAEFAETVRTRYGLDAQTIPGAREAELTFLGATSERTDDTEIVVVDIGGGSTELVVGHGATVDFFVSLQAGVVRMTERHVSHDPPQPDELTAMAEDVRAIIAAGVPADVQDRVNAAVAVAGTATSSAAIDLQLETYDPDKVHGHVLQTATLELLLARLAAMPEDDRRQVVGLHPDRAPTIVAGVLMLLEVARFFGLEDLEISEHDILRGAALARAR